MQILHLDSSVLGTASVSRQLSAKIVARQKALHWVSASCPTVTWPATRPFICPAPIWPLSKGQPAEDAIINADLLKGNAYMDELFASDIIVIGAPMYNFSIPTPLKAWVDRIAVADKTFHYTATGPEGLLKNKKAFIASARGGVYSAGSPAAAFDHQESYLISLLAFLGVTDVKVVRAEGIAFGPEAREAAIAHALEDIAAIAA